MNRKGLYCMALCMCLCWVESFVSSRPALPIARRLYSCSRSLRSTAAGVTLEKSEDYSDKTRMTTKREPGTKQRKDSGSNASEGQQAVDFTTALLLCSELSKSLVPSRVENVWQSDEHNLAIGLRLLDGGEWLTVSWHPQSARCHVGDPPPKGKERETYSFSAQLRGALQGLTLTEVCLAAPFERVVTLALAPRISDAPTHRLYLEVLGTRSNVILTALPGLQGGTEETVVCCAYQVSPSTSIRPIGVGQPYALPPAASGRAPSKLEPVDRFIEYITRVPTQTLKKALVSLYKGVSPSLVNAMALAVPGLEVNKKIGDIPLELLEALYAGPWREWLELVGDGINLNISNTLIKPWRTSNNRSYYPVQFSGMSSQESIIEAPIDVRDPISTMLAAYYSSQTAVTAFGSLYRRCTVRLTNALTRLRERVRGYQEQLNASGEDKISALMMKGDLLTSYASTWKPGDDKLTCYDFVTGEEIILPLQLITTRGGEEIQPPLQEAQAVYRQAKKFKRGAETIKTLLEQAETQVAYAESIELSLEQLRPPPADDWILLKEIAEELGVWGATGGARGGKGLDTFGTQQGQKTGGNTTSKKAPGKGKFNNKQSQKQGGKVSKNSEKSSTKGLLQLKRANDGATVLVGRNSFQNERITFQVAKAHELWFHARGVPGSHVLLRCEPGKDPSDEDIQFAADLAVYYSKARTSTNVPVDRVCPKDIRKMGAGGPGMVWYDKYEVMWAVPDRVKPIVESST